MASRTDQLKAAKKEMQRAFEKAEAEENRKIKETDEAKEPSPWLRRVGCIPHLAGIDRKEVREYVEPVDEKDEPHLAIMCTAFEWLIQDAQHHAGWKGEQEKNAAGEDRDEDEGFDDGEDDEGVEGVEGAAEEVDEGFEDEMSEETKWMRGLAILMIKGDKGWHDAEDFTTKYSAVIKLAQLMVVQEAYKQRQEQIRTYQSEMTEVEARKKATSYYRREDPVDPGRGVVSRHACPDVAVAEHGARIDWGGARRPSETKVGWSFLDDERNKFGAYKEWWLFERLYQEQALREQFLDDDGLLKPGASEAYQRHVERFLELLLILIHLCAGQPSRATEILGLQWKNTANGGVRNVIIENGLTGPEGGMKRGKGKGKKGTKEEKEKSQEEEKGRRTKSAWTSERDEDNAAGDDPWDLQAGHGTHIIGMIYARELIEGNNTIISRREKFRQGDATRGTKRKRPSFEDEMDEVQAQRWKKLRTVDIQQALEEMFGASTQFRGLQKPALEAIMKHESPILVVMGTGVGKLMLFQIPAKSVSSGTTIVITPLVLLQSHMVERCQQVGISCKKWDSQRIGEMRAQIVIVTPKSAVSKTFTTLPKHTEPKFMRIMKIKPEEVRTFRGPTTRPNITYSVHEYTDESDETEAICQLVGEKLERYAAPAKIIVYRGSIERTQELSKALGCHQYYRKVGDQEEKEAIMERWQRGDGRLIVAMNAFGLGIDAPDVRVVIYAGDIYQMRSYSQESGRGGRDGKRSEAIVVVPAGRQEELQKKIAQAKAQTQPWKI
ncbi:hypothetical protein V501_00293 [Pseudogymnoascus sp. VKM F-4519 (FW-2642)]|nr:hypothetical protein V501_00293 [Pseudogymnoascus sp. VKM F-4519 (FW-2642)]